MEIAATEATRENTGLSLSETEFKRLMRDVGKRKNWGQYKRAIKIANIDSRDTACLWHVETMEGGKGFSVANVQLEDHAGILADMKFTLSKKEGGGTIWKLTHRLVNPLMRGKQLGKLAIQATEDLLRTISTHDRNAPLETEVSTTRPSLMGFAIANGYTYVRPEDEEVIEKFSEEYEEHREDEDFKYAGKLPSYQMVRVQLPGSPLQDPALADRQKLEEYLAKQSAGQAEEILLQEKGTKYLTLRSRLGELDSVPFLVRVDLRKSLEQ